MSSKPIEMWGLTIMPGSKTYSLLTEGKPEERSKNQKAAKRLVEFTSKAEAAFYEVTAITRLRAEYSDVV